MISTDLLTDDKQSFLDVVLTLTPDQTLEVDTMMCLVHCLHFADIFIQEMPFICSSCHNSVIIAAECKQLREFDAVTSSSVCSPDPLRPGQEPDAALQCDGPRGRPASNWHLYHQPDLRAAVGHQASGQRAHLCLPCKDLNLSGRQ